MAEVTQTFSGDASALQKTLNEVLRDYAKLEAQMQRLAAASRRGSDESIRDSQRRTQAFQHELGPVYANADAPWAETFDLNLTSGARLVTLKQVLPDIKGDMLNVQFQFYTRMSRSIGAAGVWSAPIDIRPDGYVDARFTGRGMRMRLSCVGPKISAFTVGQHLVDFAVRGDR